MSLNEFLGDSGTHCVLLLRYALRLMLYGVQPWDRGRTKWTPSLPPVSLLTMWEYSDP